tara:strand:- start:195 stop:734 length:540 start_codon:yes stop_codon:yes gene_type:complete
MIMGRILGRNRSDVFDVSSSIDLGADLPFGHKKTMKLLKRISIQGEDGVGATIKSNAKFDEMLALVRKGFKEHFKSLDADFEKPETYTRPDRFTGQVAMEKGKKRRSSKRSTERESGFETYKINWSPGYAGHKKMKFLKKKLRVTSSRPYHPKPTEEYMDEFAEKLMIYIIEAEEMVAG